MQDGSRCVSARPDHSRFMGSEGEWSDWSFQARAHCDTVNPSMADHLDMQWKTDSGRMILLSSLEDVAAKKAPENVLRTRRCRCSGSHVLLLLNKVELGNGDCWWNDMKEPTQVEYIICLQSIMRPKAFQKTLDASKWP